MHRLSLEAFEELKARIDSSGASAIDSAGSDRAVDHIETMVIHDIEMIDTVIGLARNMGLLDEIPGQPAANEQSIPYFKDQTVFVKVGGDFVLSRIEKVYPGGRYMVRLIEDGVLTDRRVARFSSGIYEAIPADEMNWPPDNYGDLKDRG